MYALRVVISISIQPYIRLRFYTCSISSFWCFYSRSQNFFLVPCETHHCASTIFTQSTKTLEFEQTKKKPGNYLQTDGKDLIKSDLFQMVSQTHTYGYLDTFSIKLKWFIQLLFLVQSQLTRSGRHCTRNYTWRCIDGVSIPMQL